MNSKAKSSFKNPLSSGLGRVSFGGYSTVIFALLWLASVVETYHILEEDKGEWLSIEKIALSGKYVS